MKHSSSSRPSILVVDDDPDTCINLSDILTDRGYDVDTAHDGLDALALARRKSYDVALLDLKMPGMDGLTLYREIKRVRAGTVAVIVTAYASSATRDAALSAGAVEVLPKPVDFSRLLGLVDQALDQPLVMVIDDDHALCENLWDVLRERGYRVCIAHDDAEAAERLRGRDFRVVLIDMKLSSTTDGGKVFEVVRQLKPDARTVLITGFRSETDAAIQRLVCEGADAVCYKPFDVASLLETIARLARNHRAAEPAGEAG